jgi:hypothetical protein
MAILYFMHPGIVCAFGEWGIMAASVKVKVFVPIVVAVIGAAGAVIGDLASHSGNTTTIHQTGPNEQACVNHSSCTGGGK